MVDDDQRDQPPEDRPGDDKSGPLFVSAGDLVKSRRPIEWLIQDIIPRGSFFMLSGEAKLARKSFLLMHMGICISRGDPFLGLPTQQGRVLFINLEDGVECISDRLWMFGVRPNDDLPLYVMPNEMRYFEAMAAVEKIRPAAVIVDPLIEVELNNDIRNENDSIQMVKVLRQLRRTCRSTGTSFIMAHHAGQKTDVRGTTALKGAVDGWATLREHNEGRRMSWWVRRWKPGHVDISLEIENETVKVDILKEPVIGDAGEVKGGSKKGQDEEEGAGYNDNSYTRMCDVLQAAEGGLSKRAIRDAAKVKRSAVDDHLDMLESSGLVEKRGQKWFWVSPETQSDEPDQSPGDEQNDSDSTK